MEKSDNILLITYHPLSNLNGGTIMYKNLIENFPSENLYWIGTGAFMNEIPNFIIKRTKSQRIISSFIFSKIWIRIFSKFPLNIINLFLLYFIYSPRVILTTIYFIKKNKINYLWFETFRHTYIISYVLIRLLNIKVHLSFNDHYSAHCKWPERNLLNQFCKRLVRTKSSFDFISEGLRNYFIKKYNFRSNKYMFLWVGNHYNFVKAPIYNKNIKKIIFYGSIHGLKGFNAFCEFISSENKNGNCLIFDIYSEFDYSFISNLYENVNYLGKVSQNDLADIIIKYDLVYVPIYFEGEFKVVAQTSLSSKMLLAINMGIPIFSHGPETSANNIFVNNYQLGFTCSTLDKTAIAEKMCYANDYLNRIKIYQTILKFSSSSSNISLKTKELYELILS